MTPKERIGAFLSGQKIDRVPCVPLILNHAARIIGATIREYTMSGETMGQAHVAAYRRYGQDLICIFADTGIIAEAMGTELMYPADDVPRVVRPLVAQPEDFDKVGPIDVRRAGRLPVYLEAIRHCVREVGHEVFVSCCFAAPFTTAAGLRGTDMLARDLIKRPALAHALLKKSLAVVEEFSAAVTEAGGIPVLVDPVASGSILSRTAYEQFAHPYTVPALARIKSLGLPPILHICGKTSTIVDLMAASGAAVLSLDRIDMAEARAKVGDKVCIMGNVRPAETMLQGTPEDVLREARQYLDICKTSPGGFILATGCEVPIEAPPENVLALIEAARMWG